MPRFGRGNLGAFITDCYNIQMLPLVEDALRQQAFNIYYLDARKTIDKLSLFHEIKDNLPYWGGEIGVPSWDSMSDYLYQAITGEEIRRFAIIWSPAEELAQGHPSLLLDTLEVLLRIQLNLAWNRSAPEIIRVFLLGEGDSFPDFVPAGG